MFLLKTIIKEEKLINKYFSKIKEKNIYIYIMKISKFDSLCILCENNGAKKKIK